MAPEPVECESSSRRDGRMLTRQVPVWMLFVVGTIAVAACVGWGLRMRLLAPVWGDVATWVGSSATAAGLFFAGVQVRQARLAAKDARDEASDNEKKRRKDLARTVTLEVNPNQSGPEIWFNVTVTNTGAFPVSDVRVSRNYGLDAAGSSDTGRKTVQADVLHPGGSKHGILDRDPDDGDPPPVELVFTDSWGQLWTRVAGHTEPRETTRP